MVHHATVFTCSSGKVEKTFRKKSEHGGLTPPVSNTNNTWLQLLETGMTTAHYCLHRHAGRFI